MMKVTVLGCGPAGLFAALAAERRGADVTILSIGTPSPINGAQWLQAPVSGVTDAIEPRYISYIKLGTEDGYAQKAYGEPKAEVSWTDFAEGEYPAWSLKDAYELLWTHFVSRIEHHEVSPPEIKSLCSRADLVFCSIRADALCTHGQHMFRGQPILVSSERQVDADEVIIYNGRERDPWYRASKLFGHHSTEYRVSAEGIVPTSAVENKLYEGIKPVTTDCDCHTENINFVRVGRFGKWRRGVLTDHAYHEAWERVHG